MPITKAVTSGHVCQRPRVSWMSEYGYLAGTEWTCDVCGTVSVLVEGGMASIYWEELPPPPVEPEPEPEPEEPVEEPIPEEPVMEDPPVAE